MAYTRRTAPVNSGVMGWVITICLDEPIGGPKRCTLHLPGWQEGCKTCPDHPPKPTQRYYHTIARHWTGWCEADRLDAVLAERAAGTHCRIARKAKELGIGFEVVLIRRGDKNLERHLKRHGAAKRCRRCQAERAAARELQAAA